MILEEVVSVLYIHIHIPVDKRQRGHYCNILFSLRISFNVDNLMWTQEISDKDIKDSIMIEHLEDLSEEEENKISRPSVKQTFE